MNNTPNEPQRDQRTYPFGKIHTAKEEPLSGSKEDGFQSDGEKTRKRLELNDETLKNRKPIRNKKEDSERQKILFYLVGVSC